MDREFCNFVSSRLSKVFLCACYFTLKSEMYSRKKTQVNVQWVMRDQGDPVTEPLKRAGALAQCKGPGSNLQDYNKQTKRRQGYYDVKVGIEMNRRQLEGHQ